MSYRQWVSCGSFFFLTSMLTSGDGLCYSVGLEETSPHLHLTSDLLRTSTAV